MFTRSPGSDLVNHVSPKKEPEFAATDGGGAGDDYACNIGIDTDGCYDYVTPKDDPESKVIDVYHHQIKEEPEPELSDGDGNAVDVNGCYDCDLPEDKPEFVVMGDDIDADSDPDVGHDCSHCGISLGSRKFKLEHELRCEVRMKQKELESQVTKLYHCGYCRCPFVNEELKEQHQRRGCRRRPIVKRKGPNGTYFACDKCEFVTKYKVSFERHSLNHNKINAEWFTCTQCSYKTVHKHDVTTHMKIHGNTFSFCCPVCGKSFRKKQFLDDHLLRRHSDKSDEVSKLITSKVYKCDICDRFRTTVKTDFDRHLAVTHLKGVGSQKYQCPRCPYSTFLKYHLTTHSKTHSKQKDYRCTTCKKQFAQKRQLDSHVFHKHADNVDLMKTITSKIHCCELCSFKSVIKTHLKSHIQFKHI